MSRRFPSASSAGAVPSVGGVQSFRSNRARRGGVEAHRGEVRSLAAVRRAALAAETPVDMALYADTARARVDTAASAAAGGGAERLGPPRLTIARRPLLDLSAIAAGAGSTAAGGASPAQIAPPAIDANADLDLGSTFDVPAFLRRQEG